MWNTLLFAGSLALALLAGVICLLIYAYRKLGAFWFLLLLGLLVALPVLLVKRELQQFKLSFVPDALEVGSIDYGKEKSWGFGPGGNEAGILVYPLPASVATKLSMKGVAFLDKLPSNRQSARRGWRGYYRNWSETPVKSDSHWQRNEKTGRVDIYDYICAYGFCIDIAPDIAKQVDAIVNSPGSYYAYGRIGVIVVSPRTRQVLYMYNG